MTRRKCSSQYPVLLRTTQLAQITSQYYFVLQSLHKVSQYYFVLQSLHTVLPAVLLRTTKLARSTSQYYFARQNLHKVLPSTTWYHKTCSFKIDVFLRVFLRPDLKFDVSCEAWVDFHHMSQNATPATEFAPCNTLRSADSTIRSNTTRRKCCACHEKCRRISPKCCACHNKMKPEVSRWCESIAPATQNRRGHAEKTRFGATYAQPWQGD